jgi:hypothetical protein
VTEVDIIAAIISVISLKNHLGENCGDTTLSLDSTSNPICTLGDSVIQELAALDCEVGPVTDMDGSSTCNLVTESPSVLHRD